MRGSAPSPGFRSDPESRSQPTLVRFVLLLPRPLEHLVGQRRRRDVGVERAVQLLKLGLDPAALTLPPIEGLPILGEPRGRIRL